MARKRNTDELFISFSPAVSKQSLKAMRAKTRQSNIRNRTDMSLEEIAKWYNPILSGWINYYGCYHRSGLNPMLRHFNLTLMAWAMRKYQKMSRNKTRAAKFIKGILERQPSLFAGGVI
jgi:hypothetical protein